MSTNPATLLGFGTWVSWGTGRVPVGVDSSQTEFNAIEKTGGAKTHTLTVSEMPSHNHNIRRPRWYTADPSIGSSGTIFGQTFTTTALGEDATTNGANHPAVQNRGGGGSHNNLQPYITAYMWKRTS